MEAAKKELLDLSGYGEGVRKELERRLAIVREFQEFCNQRGVAPGTLVQWHYRYTRKGPKGLAPKGGVIRSRYAKRGELNQSALNYLRSIYRGRSIQEYYLLLKEMGREKSWVIPTYERVRVAIRDLRLEERVELDEPIRILKHYLSKTNKRLNELEGKSQMFNTHTEIDAIQKKAEQVKAGIRILEDHNREV